MSEKYEGIYHKFEVDQVLKNNNGCDYKVLEVKNQSNVKFERVKDGQIVLATLPKMYLKNNVHLVLEWAWGKYFS